MRANILALLAAFAFALGNVLQQKGTLEAPAEGDDPRFLIQILRRPVWLAGAGFQGSGWVLQAVALDTGSLIVVQSLTTGAKPPMRAEAMPTFDLPTPPFGPHPRARGN